MKPTIEQMVERAFKAEPRCIKDELLLLAWIWTKEQHPDETASGFAPMLGKIYTHLLKRSHPGTVFRVYRKYLEDHPHLKVQGPSTNGYKKELEGQTTFLEKETGHLTDERPLPLKIDPEKQDKRWVDGKQRISEIKEQYQYWNDNK